MRVEDVFVAGGLPDITYNPRGEQKLEEKIKDFLDEGYKLLSLTGPTKSGKTVLCKKCVKDDEAIWIAGGSVRNEDDIWTNIISELNLFNTIQEQTSESKTKSSEASVSGGFNAVIAKADGNIKEGTADSGTESLTIGRSDSKSIVAINGLLNLSKVLVIDDFHYIGKNMQTQVIRALKEPIFKGLRAIIIAVPHRTYDAVRAETEMTGRVEHITLTPWEIGELKPIGEKGFDYLNVHCNDELLVKLAQESWKSPHLMQTFCLKVCKYSDIREKQEINKDIKLENYDDFFKEIVESIGSKIAFERLARGPTQRADRIARKLKTGEEVDIYNAILHAIAYTGPQPEITYEELRSALRAVLQSDPPQAHEVTRILDRMDTIAKELEGEPVIDWDKESRTLYVSDPFFSLYLKWAVKNS